MTIMWTQASFNQFLLSAQMKYLEGNIFINFYIFGAAGLIAVFVGGIVYKKYGLRWSYVLSFAMSIFGSVGMIIIQSKVLQFKSEELRDQFDEKFMPILILILKMGIIMSFIITTQVSFTDDRIFPSNKRNTSVGSCGMIARSITIVAPIVNEWTAPMPIMVILAFSVLGIMTSMTFPLEHEFSPGQKIKETKYNLEGNTDGEVASDVTYHDLNENKNFLLKGHSDSDS
jgi:MFS family permease